MPQYSIIIPAYNESARLGAPLDRVLDHVAAQHWDAEVIVVNDGSRDDTAEMVPARAGANRALRLVENPGNRGKGYSVRNGMLKAQGEIRLFTDADLSSPIEEANKLFAAIEGTAFHTRIILERMGEHGVPIRRVINGGGIRSDAW